MRRDTEVGRLLVASLHQGIADLLPLRLSFYESWLTPDGLREGSIGRAPLLAVLSFLRQEQGAYAPVVQQAGVYAATWMVDAMPSSRRSMLLKAPVWLRSRLLMRHARRLLRNSQPGARMTTRVSGLTARLTVHGSVFCGVRDPVAYPLCGYYAAAFAQLLTAFNLPVRVGVTACRGTGEPACLLEVVQVTDERMEQPRGEAA
jgi:bacteriochlorophyll 4-vinyl reductase